MPSESRHALRALTSNGSATLGSPHTRRASSRPRATRTSSAAISQDLTRPPYRMIQPDPFVPNRIPDRICDRLYVPTSGVEEHDIEVAVGAERAPPVTPYGKKCQVAVVFSDGTLGHTGKPFVGLGGVGPAEIVTFEVGLGEERGTPFPERRVRGHGGNVALRA